MPDLRLDWETPKEIPTAIEVSVKGQISSANASRFTQVLDSKLDGPVNTLLLDLEEAPFVASVALSYLADLIGRLEVRGGAIAIVRIHPKLKVVFNTLNLLQFFRMVDTREAARDFARETAARLRSQPRLTVTKGPGQFAVFPIGATPLVIGSEKTATIRVDAPKIAPRHAEIYRNGSRCHVRDLGSKLGTLVGARRVKDSEPLASGDVVKIGDLHLKFSDGAGPPAVA